MEKVWMVLYIDDTVDYGISKKVKLFKNKESARKYYNKLVREEEEYWEENTCCDITKEKDWFSVYNTGTSETNGIEISIREINIED